MSKASKTQKLPRAISSALNGYRYPSSHPRLSLQMMSILLLGGLCSSLITGCFQSKVGQCNKFVAVVNKEAPFAETFNTEQQKLQPAIQKGDKAAFIQAASSFRKYSQNIDGLVQEAKALELEDVVVMNLQERYVYQQGQYSQEIQNLATAMEKIGGNELDIVELKTAQGKMVASQTLIKQFEENLSGLRTEYANYCTNGFQKEDFSNR